MVWTGTVRHRGPDRLDVSRKTGDSLGICFAPSVKLLRRYHPKWGGVGVSCETWPAYAKEYTDEMRQSWRLNRWAWDKVMDMSEVTLCCYCKDASLCHRSLLAGMFWRLGACVGGER
jgi:uncharacterized protein YeaO (DUF488 family)